MKRKSFDYEIYNSFVGYLDSIITDPNKTSPDAFYDLLDEYLDFNDWKKETSSEVIDIMLFLSRTAS